MLNVNSNFVGIQGNDSILLESEAPCLIHMLLNEMILKIFENCKPDLPALALVNKTWKKMTGTNDFYSAMFSPAFAACGFGKADLMHHFGMDLGLDEVPHLRLKDYGDVEKGICLLTYFPKEIPITNEDGIMTWVPPRAKIIGDLVKNPKCGFPTQFDRKSLLPAINEEREITGGEWVVTYKKPIGHGKAFDLQVLSAEAQGSDTDVAELEKTIYAVFMHYVKTGERCFPRDPVKEDLSVIRFKENMGEYRIVVGFGPSGLTVSIDNGILDAANQRISVAVARKPIGTCILGTKR